MWIGDWRKAMIWWSWSARDQPCAVRLHNACMLTRGTEMNGQATGRSSIVALTFAANYIFTLSGIRLCPLRSLGSRRPLHGALQKPPQHAQQVALQFGSQESANHPILSVSTTQCNTAPHERRGRRGQLDRLRNALMNSDGPEGALPLRKPTCRTATLVVGLYSLLASWLEDRLFTVQSEQCDHAGGWPPCMRSCAARGGQQASPQLNQKRSTGRAVAQGRGSRLTVGRTLKFQRKIGVQTGGGGATWEVGPGGQRQAGRAGLTGPAKPGKKWAPRGPRGERMPKREA
jgi:hypothetical protein